VAAGEQRCHIGGRLYHLLEVVTRPVAPACGEMLQDTIQDGAVRVFHARRAPARSSESAVRDHGLGRDR